VYHGGWETSLPKARKAENGFTDWDKAIVSDASPGQSFIVKAIISSDPRKPTPNGM